MEKKTILHVAFQDPGHMTGGQGVSTLSTCREQLRLGYRADYLSLRLRGEPADQVFTYKEGRREMSEEATKRAAEFKWSKVVPEIIKMYLA
jgi:hypothetical protein